jgi:hypothetical protein
MGKYSWKKIEDEYPEERKQVYLALDFGEGNEIIYTAGFWIKKKKKKKKRTTMVWVRAATKIICGGGEGNRAI